MNQRSANSTAQGNGSGAGHNSLGHPWSWNGGDNHEVRVGRRYGDGQSTRYFYEGEYVQSTYSEED